MDNTQAVEVVNPGPLPVISVDKAGKPVVPGHGPAGLPVQNQSNDPSIAATTTFQQDLIQAGQRNINFIWESTQGQIAKYVILGTMAIDGISVLLSIVLSKDFTAAQGLTLGFVNSLATGVVSFYFSRTNHTQIGGVGPKSREMGESHR